VGAAPLELRGELGPRALGRLTTLLLALCGVLFVWRAARVLGRWFLGRRAEAVVTLAEPGLRVLLRSSLLGRQTRERELLIALPHLLRVERVVRFSGLAFYAGVCTLALGSYVGTQIIVESLRGDTGIELVLVGVALIGLGLLLDFLLVTGLQSGQGRCRLRLITDDGLRLEIDRLDPPLVDALLEQLKARLEPGLQAAEPVQVQ
jgi:hypothetical protein